ncbi:MAG: sulfatase-like hydrolase/transferase [Prevotella sp.]|nr:sulfatase-like hydrolase/transferase [Prevotella sp.]
MKARLAYLLQVFGWTVLVFLMAKCFFMFFNHQGHPFSAADVWSVLTHGFTLDLSTALYILTVPILATIAGLWVGGLPKAAGIMRWVMRLWFVVVAIALSLAFVADTSLYPFWGFKLDASCLQYLSTPTEAMASVSAGYMVVRFVVWVLAAFIIYKGYPQFRLRPASKKLLRTLFYLLLLPVVIIGIRGGMHESTTNIGQVYFSQNQFLNHSAVNPVFSFLSSLEKTASDIPEYHFMEEPERAALMRDIYPTVSEQPDTLLRTSRPDIVIILLESCGGIFTDDIGGRKDIMPRFNKLVDEGVYFSNFYANSYRTDRGTLCTWSGYPSFPRSSVMKMPAKTRFLPGIAKSLLKEGYHTSYIYGGDINFTNMRSYLVTIGFDQFCWMKDYTMEQQRTSKWGVRDDITFATLYDQITAPKANGTHRLIGYSTLSSHEPWDVPTHRLSEEIPNAFNYLDECLGNFIDKMRQTPQWDNLLVVLLPDHGYSYFGVDETHELHDHVPMLWLGGALRGPRRVEQFCNQTDLPATLLGQLGLPHDDYLFSRDVMSRNYTYPFAVHTYNNGITMKDSTGFAVYDLNVNRIIVDKSTDSRHLIRRGMAILQTASEHIRQLK